MTLFKVFTFVFSAGSFLSLGGEKTFSFYLPPRIIGFKNLSFVSVSSNYIYICLSSNVGSSKAEHYRAQCGLLQRSC